MKTKSERRLVAVVAAAAACACGWMGVAMADGGYSAVAVLSAALPPISPLEAVHLAEGLVRDLRIDNVELAQGERGLVYRIEGARVARDGGAPVACHVEVDAQRACVLAVQEGGQRRYAWPGIVAVGHRGTVTLAPENTLAAFKKAFEAGAHLIEMDVRETKDHHLVIMHDATVNRTTTGRGGVAELTIEELKGLDAGSKFDPAFAGETVPTLEEALDAIAGRALPDIDFKAGDPELLVRTLDAKGLLGKVTLYCGNEDLMRRTLAADGGLRIRPTTVEGRLSLARLVEEWDPPIVNIEWEQFTEGLVRDVHLAGRKAFVNLMGASDNAFAMQAAIDAGADYIQSDHVDVLVPMLKEQRFYAAFEDVADPKGSDDSPESGKAPLPPGVSAATIGAGGVTRK